jgi:hypothetical protein
MVSRALSLMTWSFGAASFSRRRESARAFWTVDDGLGVALGLEDGGLLGGVGAEDGGLLFALGHEDGGALGALGLQNRLPAVALGLHLLLHGRLDVLRRQDVFELHAVDLDAPGVGGLVEDGAHLGVDDVAGGQRLVELEVADDVAQRGGGQRLHGDHRVLDAVGVELRVGDLVVDDGVDLHGDVVLGDDGLRGIVEHLLLEAHALGDRSMNGILKCRPTSQTVENAPRRSMTKARDCWTIWMLLTRMMSTMTAMMTPESIP